MNDWALVRRACGALGGEAHHTAGPAPQGLPLCLHLEKVCSILPFVKLAIVDRVRLFCCFHLFKIFLLQWRAGNCGFPNFLKP